MHRSRRKALAKETLEICRKGEYRLNESSTPINLTTQIQKCIESTRLVLATDNLPNAPAEPSQGHLNTQFEITSETTLQACQRISAQGAIPFALNFASAKNPGGGFLGGSQAQEESLAISSTLYLSLTSENVRRYYSNHRQNPNRCLYSHAMIYSPHCVVFRSDDGELLDELFEVNFISAPAVNAKAAARNYGVKADEIRQQMKERITTILQLARTEEARELVLGAYGCGVFGNDPKVVANLFWELLKSEDAPFKSCFEKVIFAIHDPKGKCVPPFQALFENEDVEE